MDSETFLNKIITGKRVAIIGPADYVNKELDEKHGEYLNNNFDIVIRLNNMIDIIDKDLEKYYGSKFDVLFSSFWYTNFTINSMKNKVKNTAIPRYLFKDTYEKLKDKTILYECNNRNLFNNIYDMYKDTIDKKNIYYMNSSRETYMKALQFLNNIENLSATPSTGTLAIALVLMNNPKKLYVSGVTCYLDEKYNGYFDGYTRTIDNIGISNDETLDLDDERTDGMKYKNKDQFNGKTYNYDHPAAKDHSFKAEQKILKYLVTNKLIKVDKYLKVLVKSF
jgi:hypothetical protein